MNGLVWLRSDLRIDDNPALSMASIECKKLFCVYLLADQEWKTHNNANVKLDFILRNLKSLSEDLKELNIPLVSACARTPLRQRGKTSSYEEEVACCSSCWDKHIRERRRAR